MATYKVWFTVKDSYGSIKELDAGTIDVNLPELVTQIEEALPLEDYIKRDNLDTELNNYAKDSEVEEAIKQTVRYSNFKYKKEVGE